MKKFNRVKFRKHFKNIIAFFLVLLKTVRAFSTTGRSCVIKNLKGRKDPQRANFNPNGKGPYQASLSSPIAHQIARNQQLDTYVSN